MVKDSVGALHNIAESADGVAMEIDGLNGTSEAVVDIKGVDFIGVEIFAVGNRPVLNGASASGDKSAVNILVEKAVIALQYGLVDGVGEYHFAECFASAKTAVEVDSIGSEGGAPAALHH